MDNTTKRGSYLTWELSTVILYGLKFFSREVESYNSSESFLYF